MPIAKERRRMREERDCQAQQPIEEEEDHIGTDHDQPFLSDQDEDAVETRSEPTDDPPPDEAPIRSRRGSRHVQAIRQRKRQRKMKGLPKDFKDPPELNFPSVRYSWERILPTDLRDRCHIDLSNSFLPICFMIEPNQHLQIGRN
jgi:hypothetical protein